MLLLVWQAVPLSSPLWSHELLSKSITARDKSLLFTPGFHGLHDFPCPSNPAERNNQASALCTSQCLHWNVALPFVESRHI